MATSVKKLFGEIALEEGFCSQAQIDEALALQKQYAGRGVKKPLGSILHDLGYLSLVEINRITDLVESAKRRRSIDGYDILSKLGKGAMGSVYLARQVSLKKLVAIKVMPRRLAADDEALKRFKREALATASLNHPGIVQAYDVGESNGYHYLVMEYVQGETMKEKLQREGAMPESFLINVALKMSDALVHAWNCRIVHRDVKPANIMLTREGEPKLCDLGLAISRREDNSITKSGIIMGTPYYLSPEQARNDELDSRSDIYSLGATLYHCATGKVPFDGESPAVILTKHLTDDVPDPRAVNPAISEGFGRVLMRMLAKDKEDRYASVQALIADLKSLQETGMVAPDSPTKPKTPPPAPSAVAALEREKTPTPMPTPSATGATGSASARQPAASARFGRMGAIGLVASVLSGIVLGAGVVVLLAGPEAIVAMHGSSTAEGDEVSLMLEREAAERVRTLLAESRELRRAGDLKKARELILTFDDRFARTASAIAILHERDLIDDAATARFLELRRRADRQRDTGSFAEARATLEEGLGIGIPAVVAQVEDALEHLAEEERKGRTLPSAGDPRLEAVGAAVRAAAKARAESGLAAARDSSAAAAKAAAGSPAEAELQRLTRDLGDIVSAYEAYRSSLSAQVGQELWLKAGGADVEGILEGLDAKGLRLKAKGKSVAIPYESIDPAEWLTTARAGSQGRAARLRGVLLLSEGRGADAKAALAAARDAGEDVELLLALASAG